MNINLINQLLPWFVILKISQTIFISKYKMLLKKFILKIKIL